FKTPACASAHENAAMRGGIVLIAARFATGRSSARPRRVGGFCALTAVGLLLSWLPAAAAPTIADPTGQVTPVQPPTPVAPPVGDTEIKLRLDGAGLQVGGERVRVALLRRFYAAHGFQPVWDSRQPQAAALLQAVQHAGAHGLDPDTFHAHV